MTTQNDAGGGASSDIAFQAIDLRTTRTLLQEINSAGATATKTLSSGFSSAMTSGKSLDATLAGIAKSLAQLGAKAGAQALTQGATSALSALFSSAFGTGGASASVAPFADGGVVASPTFFGSGGATGLMGERGAEAILPLARGPNGQLGVTTQGARDPVAVTVNIAAQDVESFRRSEGQITAALARAVARGRRHL